MSKESDEKLHYVFEVANIESTPDGKVLAEVQVGFDIVHEQMFKPFGYPQLDPRRAADIMHNEVRKSKRVLLHSMKDGDEYRADITYLTGDGKWKNFTKTVAEVQ